MCDTAVTLTDGGVLFAKNSDRDPNEAQVLQWHPAAVHVPGASVTVTHRAIPQSPSTFATVLSRPWWMWGAEMGANEHGLVIGNEAVFTRKAIGKARRGDEPGLIGMDLLRLALERAATRRDAVQVIVGLLERYGQDGPCSHEKPSFTYDNSYLIADPTGATVLETAGRTYAVEEVAGRGRSISNALTIADFAEAHRDPLRTAVARADTRQAQTAAAARSARTPADLMAMLRSNGGSDPSAGPTWSRVSGAMGAPNMHAGGAVASSQTVSSWVSDLRGGSPLHWVTATAEPAFSLFKPVRHGKPVDLGHLPSNVDDPETLWWRHERVHRSALRDWSAAYAVVAPERDEVEARWLADPPPTAAAFAEAADIEARWHAALLAELGERDTRPRWLRAAWRRYDDQARAGARHHRVHAWSTAEPGRQDADLTGS